MARRLLIVDDEETLTFSLYQSFILSKKDYEVATASSGEEALKKMGEDPFDLILTDIFMPGISGVDLLKKVKVEYPETKVIIMTAYGSSAKKEEVTELGALHYVEKPFDMKNLREMVFNILG